MRHPPDHMEQIAASDVSASSTDTSRTEVLSRDNRSRRPRGANNSQWAGIVKVTKVTAIEKVCTNLPCTCCRSKTPANHCSMSASMVRLGGISNTCATKMVAIRLAGSYGIVPGTDQPSGGHVPWYESRRDSISRRGGVDHALRRLSLSSFGTCRVEPPPPRLQQSPTSLSLTIRL